MINAANALRCCLDVARRARSGTLRDRWSLAGSGLSASMFLASCNALVGIGLPEEGALDAALSDSSLELPSNTLPPMQAKFPDAGAPEDRRGVSGDSSRTGDVDDGGKAPPAGLCEPPCQAPICEGGTCSCPTGLTLCSTGCTDPAADPQNCGTCGVDCSAEGAVASCAAGICERSCSAGHADCNHDLLRGMEGDGCEIDTADDAKNCGGCGLPCATLAGAVVACSSGACNAFSIKLASLVAGPLHGAPGGGGPFPSPELCANNEVVIGIRGVGDTTVYALGVDCGRLELGQDGNGYAVQVVPTSQLPRVGGNVQGPPPAFSLECPISTVVTGVSGSTWVPSTGTESLKRISLICSAVTVDPARNLVVQPSTSTLSAGAADPTEMLFSDFCGATGAVAGFTGRSGAWIDAVSTTCGTLSVPVKAQKKGSSGWVAVE